MKKLLEWLKKLLGSSSSDQSGFTLVELLVIIGVLGILAVGLLATIDPLEQLRKGSDSNRKSASVELVNAITRYYATNGEMPWDSSTSDACATPSTATALSSGTSVPACIQLLVTQGELKSTFTDSTDVLDDLLLSGTTEKVAVCFNPDSKSESLRAETKYDNLGVTDSTNCGSGKTATSPCFFCAQ